MLFAPDHKEPMSAIPASTLSPARNWPRSSLAVAALGLVWNAFGLFQFVGSLQNTPESLMAMGMSAEQALVYSSYPAWMTAAFALGVVGGVVGSLLLVLRDRRATQVFLASLLGYVVLYVGDVTEGVFAALGAPQVIVLTVVVAIAAALLAWSKRELRLGRLA
jgi:hypothetical protein